MLKNRDGPGTGNVRRLKVRRLGKRTRRKKEKADPSAAVGMTAIEKEMTGAGGERKAVRNQASRGGLM